MANGKKTRSVGRPRLPKGEAKGRIVPVRFDPDDLRLVIEAAKANKQTVSEWIRSTLRTAAEISLFHGTLHDAIESVLLKQKDFKATTSDISEEIKRRGLYTRKDGKAAKATQINARVRHHPKLFEFVEPGMVRLIRI
jgi:predicted HicB family RNase H-like nuclease